MFDIFRLSLFNQVLVTLGRSMSKFLLFPMGLITFIKIPLLNLLLIDVLLQRVWGFFNKGLKERYHLKSIWGIFGLTNLDFWNKGLFLLG
jgi:uncharacterized protein involved in cysteine biosynthesis